MSFWDFGRDATNVEYGASLANYGKIDISNEGRDINGLVQLSNFRNITPPANLDYRPKSLKIQTSQAFVISPTPRPLKPRDVFMFAKLKGTDSIHSIRMLADGNLATCEGGFQLFQEDPKTNGPFVSNTPNEMLGNLHVLEDVNTLNYGRFFINGTAAKQNWRHGEWVTISGITSGAYTGINGTWQVIFCDEFGVATPAAAQTTRTGTVVFKLLDESGTECPVHPPGGSIELADVTVKKHANGTALHQISSLTGTSAVPVTTPNPLYISYDQGPYIDYTQDGKTVYELVQLAYKSYNGTIHGADPTYRNIGNTWLKPPIETDNYYLGFSFSENPTLDVGLGTSISFSVQYITD